MQWSALKPYLFAHPNPINAINAFRKAKLRQPTGQRLSNIRTQQTKISIGPILFLYYEERLVSSSLNSKQLRFHGVRPISTWLVIAKSNFKKSADHPIW